MTPTPGFVDVWASSFTRRRMNEGNTTSERGRMLIMSSKTRGRRIVLSANARPISTHRLFRYPAKFHPPIARELLERFTSPGNTVLDPFCGSGTLLVECSIAGRKSVGLDIDPVAVFVSRIKTAHYATDRLDAAAARLLVNLAEMRRSNSEYERRQFADIQPATVRRAQRAESLWIPDIPNLFHWFRRYVIVDLARIRHSIDRLPVSGVERDFFLLCFASILRNASNADPVPVSGLEVTSHMKARDAKGRVIDPFLLFETKIRSALQATREFGLLSDPDCTPTVFQSSATDMGATLGPCSIDVTITSPPYHSAVDYYRRHQLEMFWLRLVDNQQERLTLLPQYI